MKLVERILRDYPETRNSDKLLILKVWEHEGLVLTDAQKAKFLELNAPESIRRTRQKLQEDGQYSANKEVDDVRHDMYVETREAINNEPSAISWLND